MLVLTHMICTPFTITITDPERPMIQAEALCTLAELAWTLSQSCVDICRGCLELVVTAMEHHSSVSEWSPSILPSFLA